MILLLAMLAAAPPARAGIPPARVEALVRAHASERLSLPLEDVSVRSLGLVRDLDCPEDARIRVETTPGERFIGNVDFQVEAEVGGELCERLRIRSRLEIWTPAPVTARSVAAGERVEIVPGRVLLDKVEGVPVDVEGGPYEARIPLAAGEAVTLARVRRMPDARSGQDVVLLVQRGGVRLEARGRLMADAAVGETVKVVNAATGVVVSGTLEQPGVVRAKGSL